MSDSARLRALGINLDTATDAQRQVLTSLSPDELAVVGSIQERLNAASAEVQAHRPVDGDVGHVIF
jgi:hypothetical protein